ncbi:hypothetical protein [Formosa algae]|nr:hypothetical protein [Formosa algae]
MLYNTTLLHGLVLILSAQLRTAELRTMKRIDASNGFIFQLLAIEIILIIAVNILLALLYSVL